MLQGKPTYAARRKVLTVLPQVWAEFVTDEMRRKAERAHSAAEPKKAEAAVKEVVGDYTIEATPSPSGVTHLTFTRKR